MSVKIYIKKGLKSYKENRLVTKITEQIDKKIAENPDFANSFKPATNFVELQKLHDKYCVSDVEFEDIKEPKNKVENKESIEEVDQYDKHKNFKDNLESTIEKKEVKADAYEDNDTFIDPLNREEPIVRNYVVDNEFPNEEKPLTSTKTTFGEPTSFKDSFDMGGDAGNPKVNTGQQQQKQTKQPKSDPVNPHWDDMNNGKKKRSTKKFAKYIVETVCMLSEKGFVWYANKDINESKLAEYELNQEMDLDVFVSLENGQEATVKQFFQMQCIKAEELCKIDEQEKQDLADALAEVLLEKGVGPTPTQELMLISLKIFGGQIVNLISLKSQTNSLLSQLRSMKEGTDTGNALPEEVQQQPKKIEPKEVPQVDEKEIKENKEVKEEGNEIKEIGEYNPIIDNLIETKE